MHLHAASQQPDDQVGVTHRFPSRIEHEPPFLDEVAAKKSRAAQGAEMTDPGMVKQRNEDLATANVVARRIYHESVGEKHLRVRMLPKIIGDPGQRARQVLLIAIQPAEDVAGRLLPAPVERIVHPLVLFAGQLHIGERLQYLGDFRSGKTVLDDVLDGQIITNLVGDRRGAKAQPFRLPVARRDHRDFQGTRHGQTLLKTRIMSRANLSLVNRARK